MSINKADMELIAKMIAGNNQDTSTTSTATTAKVKAKKRSIYFEVSDWKGQARLLVYPNGKPSEGRFSKFTSLDVDTVKALLDSDLVSEFAS